MTGVDLKCETFSKIKVKAIAIMMYRIVQTTGKTISGGVPIGLMSSLYQVATEYLVTRPVNKPPPRQSVKEKINFIIHRCIFNFLSIFGSSSVYRYSKNSSIFFKRSNHVKILIIGVGYVGMHLLKSLKDLNHIVYTTTRDPLKFQLLNQISDQCFLLDGNFEEELDKLFDLIDTVVILVASKGKEDYLTTYLKTALMVTKLLKKKNRPIHLIYTSSTSVYEGISEKIALEELKLSPPSKNGQILLETENCYLEYPHTTILRLSGIFGPGRKIEKRARMLSQKIMEGTGDEPTNHIHLKEIIRTILFFISEKQEGVFNVVQDHHPTRKELYDPICLKASIPLPVWKNDASRVEKNYEVSNEKIKQLGLEIKNWELV